MILKKIISFIISRFKYANKVDLIKGLLDGIDDGDIKNIYRIIDGRITPVLIADKNCNYKTIPINEIMIGIPIIIQDNKIVSYSSFSISYSDRWIIKAIMNEQEVTLEEDDHTKIYILI